MHDHADMPAETLPAVRQTVRALLERTPGFAAAAPAVRSAVARGMVNVAMAGAELLAAEHAITEAAGARPRAREAPTAEAQSAGDQLGMQATNAAAGTLRATRDALAFPQYVQSLITGVFQAITSSGVQQLESLADLLENVSASSDSFAARNIRDADVLDWAARRLPFLARGDDGALAVREGEDLTEQRTVLKDGLGLSDDEVGSIDAGDLAGTLMPLARRKMVRDRQSILATLTQMGLQRVVVDQGKLHASMDMRVDTKSASEEDKASRTEFKLNAGMSGSVGVGIWGASAHVDTSYASVESDRQKTKEEIALHAGLRSSVDLTFRTEQVPLDRMAGTATRAKLDAKALVPGSGATPAPSPGQSS
jgi:hypothetical protein